MSWIHDMKREKSKARTVGDCSSHKATKDKIPTAEFIGLKILMM